MPTLLSVARAPVPGGLPGRSLRNLLSPAGDPEWRDRLFAEFTSHGIENFAPQRTIRRGDYKLMVSLLMDATLFPEGRLGEQSLADYFPGLPGPHIRLYNLSNDPFEQASLAEDPVYSELIEELLAELEEWRVETNDPLLDVDALFELTQWHIDAVTAVQFQKQ